jgi:DNA-binding beta-propeller fold protein YncE
MRHESLATALTILLSCTAAAQHARRATQAPGTPGKLLLSGFNSDAVHTYRLRDGAPRGSVSVPGAQSIVRGPDGLLYVCAEKIDEVWRLDPATGAFVDAFVRDAAETPEDESGPLDGPTAAVFGPGGDLYVASFENDRILRYDGASGAYLGEFVTANLGGLNGPDAGTKFGPDGMLYVPSFFNDRVLRYHPDGTFESEFVAFREGDVRRPRDLVWHQGEWYVASSGTSRIVRFDAAGEFVDVFCTVSQPYSLAFNADDGHLYVVSLLNDTVRKFDGVTGAALVRVVESGSGGVLGAVYLYFMR